MKLKELLTEAAGSRFSEIEIANVKKDSRKVDTSLQRPPPSTVPQSLSASMMWDLKIRLSLRTAARPTHLCAPHISDIPPKSSR